MARNGMTLLAGASLALAGCTGKDTADDSAVGFAEGTDGLDGSDGATVGDPVSGIAESHAADGSLVGCWDVSGEIIDCGGCRFGFDADFTVSGGDLASDFSRQVEWNTDGYVYTDGGEYWGYGSAQGGNAYWTTYDASVSGYSYYGLVTY